MATVNYDFSFSKIKNIMYIQRSDKDKPNMLDINTMTFYSEKGNALKSSPAGLITAIQHDSTLDADNVLYILRTLAYNGHLRDMKTSYTFNPLLMADKLASVGYNFLQKNHDMWNIMQSLRDIYPHLTAFLKAYSADNTLTIINYLDTMRYQAFSTRLRKATSLYVPDDIIHKLYTHSYQTTEAMSDAELHFMMYYLVHDHVYEYYTANADDYTGMRDMISHIKRYFRTCRMMGIKPEKDYFKHSLMVFKTYTVNAKHYEDKAVADHNSKYDFLTQLNNDKFVIIVPKTVDEFRAEGNAQSNCVYTSYLSQVQHGDTNVIFIRKANEPEKSYITCEIRDNCIRQYLKQHNARPTDAESLAFKELIATTLKAMA